MYLCFVDESGTHGGSPVFVVGGIIIHELDAWHLQQRLAVDARKDQPGGIGEVEGLVESLNRVFA